MEERPHLRRRAVALGYDRAASAAPKVVATGAGPIAERIIELARQHGVPIREDRDLVQLLGKLDLSEMIPAELYPVIAEVFAFVYRMNLERKGSPSG
ncbi:MAG: type III secretion system protein [Chloroflexi bacterium]|nr:type III secretion system protein [Chloroflexota bacterium]